MLTPAQEEAAAKAVLEPRRVATFTPILVGLILDCLLQGIFLCQVTRWARKSWCKERWTLRTLATYIAIACTSYTCVQIARALQIFAVHFGEYRGLGYNVLSKGLVAILFLVHIPVEFFFAHRAYTLSNCSRPLAVLMCTMIMGIAGLAIASLVIYPTYPNHTKWTRLNLDLFISVTTLVAATDVIITAIILVQLWKRRVGTGGSSQLIKRLMILSVESQLPPSIFAIVICVMDATGNLSYTFPLVMLLTKTSSITLFNVLNSRRTLRAKLNPKETTVPPPRTDPDFEVSTVDKDSLQTPGVDNHAAVLSYGYSQRRRRSEQDVEKCQYDQEPGRYDDCTYSFDEIISKSEKSRSSHPPPTPYLPSIRSEVEDRV